MIPVWGCCTKVFLLNFSQNNRKINDVIIGTESSTPGDPLGWRAHTTFNNCRGDTTRVPPGGTASLMLWIFPTDLKILTFISHIFYQLYFARNCLLFLSPHQTRLENKYILGLKPLIYVSQYTCFLKCGRKIIKLKSALNTNLFLWFNAVGNHELPDPSGISQSAL